MVGRLRVQFASESFLEDSHLFLIKHVSGDFRFFTCLVSDFSLSWSFPHPPVWATATWIHELHCALVWYNLPLDDDSQIKLYTAKCLPYLETPHPRKLRRSFIGNILNLIEMQCPIVELNVIERFVRATPLVQYITNFAWRKIRTCWVGSAIWFWPSIVAQIVEAGKKAQQSLRPAGVDCLDGLICPGALLLIVSHILQS